MIIENYNTVDEMNLNFALQGKENEQRVSKEHLEAGLKDLKHVYKDIYLMQDHSRVKAYNSAFFENSQQMFSKSSNDQIKYKAV